MQQVRPAKQALRNKYYGSSNNDHNERSFLFVKRAYLPSALIEGLMMSIGLPASLAKSRTICDVPRVGLIIHALSLKDWTPIYQSSGDAALNEEGTPQKRSGVVPGIHAHFSAKVAIGEGAAPFCFVSRKERVVPFAFVVLKAINVPDGSGRAMSPGSPPTTRVKVEGGVTL